MENFLIGHYDQFDVNKQINDYRESFWGVEVCLLKSTDEVDLLLQYKAKSNFNVGIHFPLRANQWNHRDPQYLSNNVDIRNESYEYMESELHYARKVDPSYVLLHYPKPVILDERWIDKGWRFGHESEYCFESEYDIDTFVKRSESFFKWFSEKSKEYDFEPLIELDAVPPYIYETSILQDLLNKYPRIRICADVGRLHLQEMIDDNFDSFSFLESIRNYISEIHLWNIQVTDRAYNNHHPALPKLERLNGWADVKRYFEVILKGNSNTRVLFEHNSGIITNKELEECYEWVNELCKKFEK